MATLHREQKNTDTVIMTGPLEEILEVYYVLSEDEDLQRTHYYYEYD